MRVTKKIRIKPPKTYLKKPSEVEAVTIPHPGASYNPTFEDHQELLNTANHVENKKLKEKQKLYRALDAKFPKVPISEEEYLKEMSAGIIDNDSSEEDSSDKESEDLQISNRATISREDKKTEKQRKKEKTRKLQEKSLKLEKMKKVRNHDLNR